MRIPDHFCGSSVFAIFQLLLVFYDFVVALHCRLWGLVLIHVGFFGSTSRTFHLEFVQHFYGLGLFLILYVAFYKSTRTNPIDGKFVFVLYNILALKYFQIVLLH